MKVRLLSDFEGLNPGIHDLQIEVAKRLISEGRATAIKEKETATNKKAHAALQVQKRSGNN